MESKSGKVISRMFLGRTALADLPSGGDRKHKVGTRFTLTRRLVRMLSVLAGIACLSCPGAAAQGAGNRPGATPEAHPRHCPAGETPGSGDGLIHIIPALSSVSLKNGDRVTVQAVIYAEAGVASVTAAVEREGAAAGSIPVAVFALAPEPEKTGGAAGLWQADWVAAGLEQAFYRVALTVTDRSGHAYTDRSLRFSDPIAGSDAAGTTGYPDGGMRLAATAEGFDSLSEIPSWGAAVGPVDGYAWFATNTSPAKVVKVALGDGDEPPVRVSALTLEPGEDDIKAAVIDQSTGYAWFGTNTSPAKVIKVALGDGDKPPVRVGALTLEPGEDNLHSAVIDPVAGYAWFGTRTNPARVVKVALGDGNEPPVRVGALTLAGRRFTHCAVIDPAAGYAWFALETVWESQLVKVALGDGDDPPTFVGVTSFGEGVRTIYSAVIDAAAGYAWFGTVGNPGEVAKMALGDGDNPPARVGAITLESGENNLYSAVIDTAAGYAYFGTGIHDPPAKVVKVALGDGDDPPVRVGALTMDAVDESTLPSAVIDPAAGYAWFGISGASPGRVAKVALGDGDAPPARVGAVILAPPENNFQAALIDTEAGYAYFGTNTSPAKVVKVTLGDRGEPPIRVGAVTLEEGENNTLAGVIDAAAGYAYFGTYTAPGRVVKVALGDGDAPPARVGAVTLESGENFPRSAVIDPAAGYAYFGTHTAPGRVIKVALGDGDDPPARVGAITLGTWDSRLVSAVIDPDAGYAYFGTYSIPSRPEGRIVKVALGDGDDPPVRVGRLTLEEGEDDLRAAIIDPQAGYAIFGVSTTTPARLVKIALGAGDASPTRVATLALDEGEDNLDGALFDPAGAHAWFRLATTPARLVKVAPGAWDEPPTRVGAFTLAVEGGAFRKGVFDPAAGYAWFGTNTSPGQVVKVALSQKDLIRGSRFAMPESGEVESVSFYAHSADGQVRLALYGAGPEPHLLWQSAVTPVAVADDWLTVEISEGAPPALDLPPGEYLMAWQVDTAADIPGYTEGDAEEGFFVPYSWADFPPVLGAAPETELESTSDRWGAYITYKAPPASPSDPGTGEIETGAITWTWRDNSEDETGFKVYAGPGDSAPETVTHTTAGDVESWRQDGLEVNTRYAMRVSATNEVGDSAKTDNLVAWTLAAVPSAPEAVNPTPDSVDVKITPGDGNPAHTEYALHCSPVSQWVQADGSLAAEAAWQTAAGWGTMTVSGLSSATVYDFSAAARNGAGVQTAPGASSTVATNCMLNYVAGPGGTLAGETTQAIPYGGSGSQVTAVPDTGHHFSGWSDGLENIARVETAVTGNLVVTALFAPDTYDVSFDAQGGTAPEPPVKQVTFTAAYGELPETSRPEKAFSGWFTDPVAGARVTEATTVTVAADHTLYAQWTEIGDISGSGSIDHHDLTLCLHMIVGLPVTIGDDHYAAPDEYPEWLFKRADVNRDGVLDILDALLIMRMVIGLDPDG